MDCKMCGKIVDGEIIRAIGFVFHPDCFKCCVCNRNLSEQEIPFTADKENRLYCQPCYNEYVFLFLFFMKMSEPGLGMSFDSKSAEK